MSLFRPAARSGQLSTSPTGSGITTRTPRLGGGTIHHSPDWSATEYAPGTNYAWGFDFYYGGQYDGYKTFSWYAWAVHAGNVGAPTFGASVFRVIWFIPSRQRKPWTRQLLARDDGGLVQFFAEPSPKFKRQLCKLPRTGWAAVQDKDRREQNQDLLTAIVPISSLSVIVELAQY